MRGEERRGEERRGGEGRGGDGEECFNVIKLEKKMEEKKTCSFHPKTVCHPSRMKECRQVKKKMCNYLDSNRL